MNQQEALDIFLKTGALLKGHFELRSGLHSAEFFQCAKVLMYPVYAEQLCRAVIEKVKEADPFFAADMVISPALGGIPVGHEMARALELPHIFAEKVDGVLVLRRGFCIEPGKRYFIGEDVVTRGGRVKEVIDIVRAGGGVVSAVGILVDRSGGNHSVDAPLFSLVQLTPETWQPSICPLCADKVPIDYPGSK
ncbi:MAG: orotate phosphoribosyltransferase [Spartobacteria bacterium]|nr:orotate phosphoribosyltransferase [Spartobacteria bacterium]